MKSIRFRYFLITTIFLTIIFFLVGYLFFPLNLDTETNESAILPEEMNFWGLFWHNLVVCLLVIILSGVSFGIYYVVYLMQNFLVMGSIISQLQTEQTLMEILGQFIIHGIFELPAILLAAALGIYVPVKIIRSLFIKHPIKHEIIWIGKLTALIVILLFIAAFIEVYISVYFI